MSKHRVKGVKAYYDSEEGIAWGPYTAREMKDDLQRPRPKPKQRRTVYKIACKSPPSTSSSNDTMFTATSELEKENNSRICNIDDTNSKTAEGSSMTTYYSADNTNTKGSSMTTYYSTDNKTQTVTSKGDCNDSVITISSDEEDGYEEQMSNTYGNMNSPVLIKKENESDEEVIILDDSTDEKFSNHTPDRLEEQMTELSLSEKPNDSGMVETMCEQNSSSGSSYKYRSHQKNIPAICLEDCETTLNDCGLLKTRPVSERRDSGLKLHDNSNTMNQVEESDSSDGDTSFDVEASNHIEEITKAVESHSNNNSPHLPNLSCSNINNNYELRITRASDDSDIPDSDICHQAKAESGNRLNLSSKESDATFAGSIHLDLSTDSSSVFDGSYFEGKEPWDAELDTTVEDEPCEPKQVPEKPAKLTPAKYETKKAKITPGKTTPQVFKVPEAVSTKKMKTPLKYKDIVSPVRLYIQHSPMAHLKQKVVPHPVESLHISPKTSPKVSKTDASDKCDMLPPVLYKPPAKSIVTTKSKQMFMPPSLAKHVKDPLVVKHEKKLNVQDVSRLSQKLVMDESSLGSETDADSSVNMSVLCVKTNFN